MKFAIFFCDLDNDQVTQAKKWSRKNGVMREGPNEYRLSLRRAKPDIELRVDSNVDGRLIKTHKVTQDLIACACFIYQADRMIKRPDDWNRYTELHIGVHEVRKWNLQSTQLKKILELLTRDFVRIRFYPLKQSRNELALPELVGQYEGGVCVFLDDLDAVAGAAIVHDSNPIVASYRYGPGYPLENQQNLIRKILTFTNPIKHVGFRINPISLDSPETTQRTNGFLQLALASAVTQSDSSRTLSKIQVFANGVTSYHLRGRQLCGPGLSVRDTNPEVLKYTQNLFQSLFPGREPFKILNPFQFHTPTQVLKELRDRFTDDQGYTRALELFAQTNNCSEKGIARIFAVPYCGCCYSCKLRRLAALPAAFDTGGNHDGYAIDPLDPGIPPQIVAGLSPHKHLWKRFEDYHKKGLPIFKSYIKTFSKTADEILAAPEIGETIKRLASQGLDLGGQKAVQSMQSEIVALHQRFAKEVSPYI
jgi:hypothetical protein